MSRQPTQSIKSRQLAKAGDGQIFPNGGRPSAWLVATVLAIAIGIIYGPALNVPLIFDDVDTIVRNASITSLWPLIGSEDHPGPLNPAANIPTAARPLVNLSFAVNYQFSQLRPSGYHAVNALIHFLSAMLLYSIVRQTLRLQYFANCFAGVDGWLAFAVATIWALHPLQTEAVIYATQRTELMFAFFYLATLDCSLRYWASDGHPRQRSIWLALATATCLAGMASKEVMASAPLMVLLFERTFISGSLPFALRKSWPLYLSLAATWILLLGLSLGSPHSGAAGFNLGPAISIWWLTQAKIFWIYLKLAIWPDPLLLHYKLPYVTTWWEGCLYIIPLLLIGFGTLLLLWQNRPSGFLGTCVFALLAPTSLIPIVTEMAAERRMYLPLAALVTLIVVGGYRLAEAISSSQPSFLRTGFGLSPITIMLPVLIIAAGCGIASAHRLEQYHQPLELWRQVLLRQPENDIAHHAIGKYLDDAGDAPNAVPYFREAARLNPDLASAHYNLGVLLFKTHAYSEAATEFAEGARLSPGEHRMLINLAAALSLSGQHEKALIVQHRALALSPDDWRLYHDLGEILKNLGRHGEAIQAYQTAIHLNPDGFENYNDIADSYFQSKQPALALAALQRGLEIATASGDREKIEGVAKRIRDKK